MNKYFDFTSRQLKFLTVLTIITVISGTFILIKSYATPTETSPNIEVFSDSDEHYLGIFVLDPNTAPADSLELIPGIGKKLADRILEYRKNNRFKKEVDITEIRGIGAKTYEYIKPYLK
ncbi:MAG: helix-hairpin-helix domain-containing protein, partial [candidate division Zixibacteria bacterium]|nr:helix-hairpin-helix domain-containing protein [candidate division Zixibacteria bacterium]